MDMFNLHYVSGLTRISEKNSRGSLLSLYPGTYQYPVENSPVVMSKNWREGIVYFVPVSTVEVLGILSISMAFLANFGTLRSDSIRKAGLSTFQTGKY
jgi:hypothetical protein